MESMTIKQSQLMPIVWPSKSKSNGLCLTCDVIRRERFNWFCSDICERVYIDSHRDR